MPSPSNLYATVLARLAALEPTATFEVTHYTLSLGDAHATTGMYAMTYSAGSTINMIIITKASMPILTGMGIYVRTDATGLTLTAISDGDKIEDQNGLIYKVLSVKPHPWGDALVTYEASLVYQVMES